jgi:phosphoglucosamine mutase
MGRLFGTDGVRGLANADLTPELAMALAAAAAHTLAEHDHTHPPVAIVGRDPRASGEMLEAAVVAGLASTGAIVVRAGVLPTPGLAYLVTSTKADLGVMISASHNPMPDNGIKLFSATGQKLPDDVEDEIEATLTSMRAGQMPWQRPIGAGVGRVHDLLDGAEHYAQHLVGTATHGLDGLTVVVDCANGAASDVAPSVYESAGATVIKMHADPDGININNDCGSTHMASLQEAVVRRGASLGIAHDGDADRCLAVDANGKLVDGDRIMAILAVGMAERGELVDDTLVATVMSNLGLKIAMSERGIKLIETRVGDRYVLEALRNGGYALGGEQSGHVIMPAHSTTGDGVLTALHLMVRMAETGKSLAELASVVTTLPQTMINVRVADRSGAASHPLVSAAVDAAAATLGGTGRVLLRPSGTEPVVRVMVEAPTESLAASTAEQIAAVVREASPV